MDIILFSDGASWVHRLDARVRLIAAVAFSLLLSQSQDLRVLLMGAMLGAGGLVMARVPVAAVLQRLVPLNTIVIFLVGMLMFTTDGEALFRVGGMVGTREGVGHGLEIFLKANAIVSLLACLVGTIEFVALGRALGQLRVPLKLVHILLFTIRYINLMLSEYERLSRAAMLRGFRPGPNPHTLRTTGYLVGMVLVRSYARGARMLEAMKLRGYDGTLRWGGGTRLQRRDHVFLTGVLVATGALLGLELT